MILVLDSIRNLQLGIFYEKGVDELTQLQTDLWGSNIIFTSRTELTNSAEWPSHVVLQPDGRNFPISTSSNTLTS
jgi:hypothetical protein